MAQMAVRNFLVKEPQVQTSIEGSIVTDAVTGLGDTFPDARINKVVLRAVGILFSSSPFFFK